MLSRIAKIIGVLVVLVSLAFRLGGADQGSDLVAFDIPAGRAEQSLVLYSKQAGLDLIYPSEQIRGINTPAVSGLLTPEAALRLLVSGTGLEVVHDSGSDALAVINPAQSPVSDPNQTQPDPNTSTDTDNMNFPEKPRRNVLLQALVSFALATSPITTSAQQDEANEDEIFELSPFTVEGTTDVGYLASSSLAGTRLRTDLRDLGTSVSVLTEEFLNDLGATDALSVLPYTANFEVAGPRGNYLGAGDSPSFSSADETNAFFSPSTQTRVRGLVNADNTRNYFRTNVSWDSYNVSRIDLLRGPNGILFGLGSPGGVVNASLDSANLGRTSGEIRAVFDQFGTSRYSLNYNQVVLDDELAIRIAFLDDNEDFRQEEAYDDETRYYVTGKWRPSFLNIDRKVFFEINADYERGDQSSNRPRNSPPNDQITPFFEPVTVNPIQLPAGTNYNGYANGVVPGFTHFIDGYTVPYEANINKQVALGVVNSFDGNGVRHTVDADPTTDFWITGRMSAYGVLQPNGTVYTGNPPAARRLWGVGYLDQVVASIENVAQSAGHPFARAFSPLNLTDTSVFDFYNHLLDGPNKEEWGDFEQKRFSITNTFFDGLIGYEVSFFEEDYFRAQTTFLGSNNRIFIDINEFLVDGTPNPHLGKPYTQETTFSGNRTRETEIDSYRASAFLNYDFRDHGDQESWWRRLLGRHLVNGVWSEDTTFTDTRNVARHVYGDELVNTLGWRRFNNNTRVTVRYYLSDDLRGRSDLSGANLSSLARNIIPEGGPINLRIFNTTWNAPAEVATNAPWVNPLGQNWDQAANPANYIGWQTRPYAIVYAFSGSQADKDLATRQASLEENIVESKILTWQGYLFDGILVGTYGWRRDESTTARTNAPGRDDGGADVDPLVYNLDLAERFTLETESRNYSVVAHLTRLPWLDRLPIDVSATYNKGQNFNPTAGRVDMLNRPLSPPQGETEEWGVLLTTSDDKYSLRVQRYETTILNDSAPTLQSNFRLQQFFGPQGAGSAYAIATGIRRQDYELLATPPDWSIDDQENLHAPAWYAFEAEFAQRFPSFIDAWLTTGTWDPSNDETNFGIFGAGGATTTQDTVSKGWEIEFTANPTPALRLTLNASRTEASRDNVPGAAMEEVINYVQNALFDGTEQTVLGQMRSGYDWVNETQADFWLREIYSNYNELQQLNGQLNPELVEWRVNALANYTFQEGRLEGFGIGGAYRWESGAAIGYPRFFDEFGFVVPDIDNPFERGSTDQIDLWIRYGRKVKGVDWTIQLNVNNAFGDNDLVPVRANPDGQVARYRIQDGAFWRITNTFRF